MYAAVGDINLIAESVVLGKVCGVECKSLLLAGVVHQSLSCFPVESLGNTTCVLCVIVLHEAILCAMESLPAIPQ